MLTNVHSLRVYEWYLNLDVDLKNEIEEVRTKRPMCFKKRRYCASFAAEDMPVLFVLANVSIANSNTGFYRGKNPPSKYKSSQINQKIDSSSLF